MVQMYVYVRIVASYRFITIPSVTVAAPCVRLFRKKCGWMHAERMSLMFLISIWFYGSWYFKPCHLQQPETSLWCLIPCSFFHNQRTDCRPKTSRRKGGIHLHFTYMGFWNELSSPHSYHPAGWRTGFQQPVEGQWWKFLSSHPGHLQSVPRKISGGTKEAVERG